jgi:hypothetical protein
MYLSATTEISCNKFSSRPKSGFIIEGEQGRFNLSAQGALPEQLPTPW